MRPALPALVLALAAGAALADEATHHGHGAHPGGGTAATHAYKVANDAMHRQMDIAYSDDADIDFLRGMIAHHQGAVAMAEVQLKYGKDAQVKRLAREIIRAQNLEIRWMEKWLTQLEGKPAPERAGGARPPYHDESWYGKTWLGER